METCSQNYHLEFCHNNNFAITFPENPEYFEYPPQAQQPLNCLERGFRLWHCNKILKISKMIFHFKLIMSKCCCCFSRKGNFQESYIFEQGHTRVACWHNNNLILPEYSAILWTILCKNKKWLYISQNNLFMSKCFTLN